METQVDKAKDFETSDNILVHQALATEQKAFEALVNRYEHLLFGLIYRCVGEYHEAQDVLQQVWLQLYLSLPTFDPHVHVKPWLFKVERNRSLDLLRSKRLLFFPRSKREMRRMKKHSCKQSLIRVQRWKKW